MSWTRAVLSSPIFRAQASTAGAIPFKASEIPQSAVDLPNAPAVTACAELPSAPGAARGLEPSLAMAV